MFVPMAIRADACILKRVVHDWPDEKAIQILANCRDVIAPSGRIVVIEPVVTSLCRALVDVGLLAFGGRERTEADFQRLFKAAGLRLTRVVAATRLVSVVEGVVG